MNQCKRLQAKILKFTLNQCMNLRASSILEQEEFSCPPTLSLPYLLIFFLLTFSWFLRTILFAILFQEVHQCKLLPFLFKLVNQPEHQLKVQ